MAISPHDAAVRPAVGRLEASFNRSAATTPPPLVKAFTRRTEAVARLADRPGPSADDLPVAVLAAVENGTDPATDPDVQRVLVGQSLAGRHNLAAEVESILIDQLRTVCTENATAIVDAWRGPFDRNAKALAEARDVLGAIPLDDTAAVVHAGPDATAAWSTARDGLGVIEAVVSGWMALHQLITGSLPRKDRRLNVIADIDATTWIDDDRDGAPADAWAAIGAGYDLRLASVEDYARSIAAIEETRRAADDATNTKHRRVPAAS